MTLGRLLPLPVVKEVRALLPLWLGCLAALVCLFAAGAGGAIDHRNVEALGTLVYSGTSIALGALSIGHEYTHRTLALVLCQPTSRARILVVKLIVLAIMLLALAGVARVTVFIASGDTAMIVTVSMLCGLFLAPWLTLLCRNPLAGAVFVGPVAGWVWVFVRLYVAAPLRHVLYQRSMLGLCAIAAVVGWRMFMRLEAIEGRGMDLHLAMAATAFAPARRRNPIWLLAKKELGLQQLTFAVAGLYLVGWGFVSVLGQPLRSPADDLLGAMTFVYSGLLALLIGSQASAEERQLGTLEWQVLLPMASWKQGALKAGVALGLAMLLAVGLPALLLSISGGHVRINEWYACAVLMATVVSLYVSSLSASGLRAFLLSLPVSLAALLSVMGLLSSVEKVRGTPPAVALFALLLAEVVYLALLNHRSADRGAWRVCVQVFCIAGCLAFGAAVLTVFR